MSDPFHAPAGGDLFGPRALCGTTPADADGLWLAQIKSDVTCTVCRDLLEGGR